MPLSFITLNNLNDRPPSLPNRRNDHRSWRGCGLLLRTMKYVYAVLASVAIHFQSPAAYGLSVLWSLLALFELVEESTDKLIKATNEKK